MARVDVLLERIEMQATGLVGAYQRDLQAQRVSDDLLYAVRSLVQDCQSALDWTASDIAKTYLKPRRPYFPLVRNPADFPEALDKQLKGLAAGYPAIADAIERHQPYQLAKASLGYLHALARVNKHEDFVPQTRHESPRFEQRVGGVSVSWAPGTVTVGPGAKVTVGGRPFGDPVTTRHVVYVDWRFADPPISVLPTLQDLSRLVRDAVREVRQVAAL